MLNLRLGFDHPGYLWLLLGLPILWWIGYESLGALGRFRRWVALLFRTVVWTAIVFAIAGAQLVWVSNKITVMYLLDQSASIPPVKRQAMLDYVVANVERHRVRDREDRAGIVVFGRDASIEIPPFDDNIYVRRLAGTVKRKDATNLESALNLAQASMSEDTLRRIVIVTDGNENLGQAKKLGARLGAAGIGIDVVPVLLESETELLVEKLDLPSNIRKGQPFDIRGVITKYSNNNETTKHKVRLTQSIKGGGAGNDRRQLLLEQEIDVEPGKNVVSIQHTIEQPASYNYELEIVPTRAEDDGQSQNNSATAYTYVSGKGRVLMIEAREHTGDYDRMVEALLDADIEVVQQYSDELFGTMAELQAYDAVILAGVPRVTGDAKNIVSFTDDQIAMLVRNTEELGAGLFMIGGPEALGAGGWTGSEIEKAMPVDFKIKNTKINTVGALALIMHASEMAQGNHWQKVIARAAIEQLGPQDLGGVLHWTMSGDAWLWANGSGGLLPAGRFKKAMMAAIGRMTPGDMPQFDPAMRMAASSLSRAKAAVKHCIIISDGDPSDPSPQTINAFKNANVTISTVAVASHGLTESRRLRTIAQQTGGKYYAVASGKALPRIFQREARRVAKPLVYEPEGGMTPTVVMPHALLDGISGTLPNIKGFVFTQTKAGGLPQVLIQSDKPEQPENQTVLAVWPYGYGRTAVLTTDAGARWASAWNDWPGYDRFFSQLVRWLMRPTGNTGKFTIATQIRDNKVEVIVNALDKDDSFLNFLDMSASALDPEFKSLPLIMRQAAPGRYVGSFPVDGAGSYFINVIPQPGTAPLRTGVTIPYSAEFRVRESNLELIETLAAVKPKGGDAGVVTPALEDKPSEELVDQNAFRGGLALARSIRDAWPWFVFTGCFVFLADVFVRRVSVDFSWMGRLLRKITNRTSEKDSVVTARLDALRRNKDAIDDSIEKRRASLRFEPTAGEGDGEAIDLSDMSMPSKPKPDSAPKAAKEQGPTYTERLLEAKRKAKKK